MLVSVLQLDNMDYIGSIKRWNLESEKNKEIFFLMNIFVAKNPSTHLDLICTRYGFFFAHINWISWFRINISFPNDEKITLMFKFQPSNFMDQR